jgi:hypothetical protein
VSRLPFRQLRLSLMVPAVFQTAIQSRRDQFPYYPFRCDHLAELPAPASLLCRAFVLPSVNYQLLRREYLE